MKPSKNPVTWFEIYVDDMDRAQKFYEAVLDVKLEAMSGDEENPNCLMAVFPYLENAADATGALVKMEGMKTGGNSTIVYFACEDCALELSRVEKAGGKIAEAKLSIGEHGFVALCNDTEGNCIGLHSMK